ACDGSGGPSGKRCCGGGRPRAVVGARGGLTFWGSAPRSRPSSATTVLTPTPSLRRQRRSRRAGRSATSRRCHSTPNFFSLGQVIGSAPDANSPLQALGHRRAHHSGAHGRSRGSCHIRGGQKSGRTWHVGVLAGAR